MPEDVPEPVTSAVGFIPTLPNEPVADGYKIFDRTANSVVIDQTGGAELPTVPPVRDLDRVFEALKAGHDSSAKIAAATGIKASNVSAQLCFLEKQGVAHRLGVLPGSFRLKWEAIPGTTLKPASPRSYLYHPQKKEKAVITTPQAAPSETSYKYIWQQLQEHLETHPPDSATALAKAIRCSQSSIKKALNDHPDIFVETDWKIGLKSKITIAERAKVAQPQGPAYIFFLKHVPLPYNYAHSEIWSDQEPGTGNYREPSKTAISRQR